VRADSAVVSAWLRVARRLPFRTPSAREVRRWTAAARSADERRRSGTSDPNGLVAAERSRYSQNGEDGIIAALVERVGPGDRTFVEVGAADGRENCTRALVEDGWSGVWIEGDADKAAAARAVVADRPVVVVDMYVDAANITDLLDGAGAAAEPTVLVVDIDGNDYWVLAEVLGRYRPRVVAAEYNARVGPTLRWAMPYDPGHAWDETADYGMSLAALADLGASHGYRLAGCNSTGVNAFLVRDDLADAAGLERHPVRTFFQPPEPLGSWHPWAPVETFAAEPVDRSDAVGLSVDQPPDAVAGPGATVRFTVALENRSDVVVGSPATDPVHLAWRWRAADGRVLDGGEPPRLVGPAWRAQPGATQVLTVAVPAPDAVGRWELEVTAVQEHVRWFEDPGRLVVPISVRT